METATHMRRLSVNELVTRGAPIISFASVGVFMETLDEGVLHLGRMDYLYHKTGRTTVRHISETGEPGETVLGALRRCVRHEAVKDESNFKIDLLSERPIFVHLGVDDDDINALHLRTAWPLALREGEFRKEPMQDGDATLGEISLCPARRLISETELQTSSFHWQSSYAALKFAASDQAVRERYESLLSRGEELLSCLSPRIQAAIDRYLESSAGSWK